MQGERRGGAQMQARRRRKECRSWRGRRRGNGEGGRRSRLRSCDVLLLLTTGPISGISCCHSCPCRSPRLMRAAHPHRRRRAERLLRSDLGLSSLLTQSVPHLLLPCIVDDERRPDQLWRSSSEPRRLAARVSDILRSLSTPVSCLPCLKCCTPRIKSARRRRGCARVGRRAGLLRVVG